MGVRKGNNQGLVTTTGGADLAHDMPTQNSTTVKIRKVMWSNNTGANETIIIGTQDNLVAPTFVPLFPTITCINGFDGVLLEEEIPDVEFVVNTGVGVAGATGDIVITGSAAGLLVRLTVEEIKN